MSSDRTLGDIQRAEIERLLKDHGMTMKAFSEDVLERNHSYTYNFLRRHSPIELQRSDLLAMADRFTLSSEFMAANNLLSDQNRHLSETKTEPVMMVNDAEVVMLPYFDMRASAGAGAALLDDMPAVRSRIPMRRDMIDRLRGNPKHCVIFDVDGDSMDPTLRDGDQIIVDLSQGSVTADALYVLQVGDDFIVKRLARNPIRPGRVGVLSDNPAYHDYPDVDLADLTIIGRVIWTGRAL